MAVTPESETEQASTQAHRVDPSQPLLAAPEDLSIKTLMASEVDGGQNCESAND